MKEVRRGTIIRLAGTWGSGLAMLWLNDDDRGEILIPCENVPAVAAFDRAFGGVITPAHTFTDTPLRGKRIYYNTDAFGVLLGFTPLGDATPEIIEEYERAGRKMKGGNTHVGLPPPDDPIYSRRVVVAGRRILGREN
jgi:hypothetical protein